MICSEVLAVCRRDKSSSALTEFGYTILLTSIPSAAINDIKAELHATDQQISLSLSIFILVQGSTPLVWSALSEIIGRKVSLYLISWTVRLTAYACAATACLPCLYYSRKNYFYLF